MTELGFSNELAEVHKSGVFRAWALHKFGGLYSDMDILYTKPFPKIKGRLFFKHPDGHYADGLLQAEKGDLFFRELLVKMGSANTSKYQSFGPTLWDSAEGTNMSKDLVYSTDWQHVDNLFNRNNGLPEEAIGIHWFGGSIEAGQWENKIKPNSYYDTTIGNIIHEI